MELIILYLLICLYPYFSDGCSKLLVDLVSWVFLPVKMIVMLINYIKSKFKK